MCAGCLSRCPECGERAELALVKRDRLVRRCAACGHRWSEEREEREVTLLTSKGFVSNEFLNACNPQPKGTHTP